MPIAKAQLGDGSVLRYYVPEGTTPEERTSIYAPAALQKVEMGIDPLEPPETTLGGYVGEVGRGLASGAAGLVESAATGAAFLLPEEQEQAARKAIAEKGAQVQAGLRPEAGYEDTVARKFAEAAGSTIPFLATGAFGGLGALAGRAALGTGVGLGAAAGAGEAAKRAEAAGATEEQISKAAGLGLIPGLGETLVPFAIGKSIRAGMAARGLGKSLGEAPAGDALARLRRVATAAGGEGLQEASAEVAQNLISQGVYDPETGTFSGTGESLGYGAGVGGLLAALAELAIPGKPRGVTTTEQDTAAPVVAPVAETPVVETPTAEPVTPTAEPVTPTAEPTAEPIAEPTATVTEDDLAAVGAAPETAAPEDLADEQIAQALAEAAKAEERQAAEQAERDAAAELEAETLTTAKPLAPTLTDEDLYTQAVDLATEAGTVSASSLQRKFRIGYNRAARIVEQMEAEGIVSPRDSKGMRTVLPTAPVADLGAYSVPTEAPVVEAPVVEAPVVEAPVAEPVVQAPVVEAPVDTQPDVADIEAVATAADEGIDLADPDADVAAVEERRQATQAAAPTGREEDNLLIYTQAAAKPKGPVGKYFATQKDFQGGIDALAQDLVSTDQKKIPKAAKEASDWIRKNLSAAANKDLRRAIVELKTTLNDLDGLPLPVEAIAATSQPLPQQIRDNLSAGDLRAAINNLAQSADQTVSRVASAIEKGLGNTKVVMSSGVVNAEGKTVAGLYDPRTDTITLNQDIPLKNHVLLHESMHAVTSHEIAKNTPAAQQMRKLFESVKDRLDTAYGSTNLDEFVAEAFSNPEFQAKLGRFTDKGEKISLWSKFKNIVNNMIRRYRGQPSKTVKSAMDKADMLVEDLISPAPESRDAAKLYSATVEETEKATLNSLGRFAKGKLREEDVATVSGYYAAASTATKNAMTQILPLNAVYKIAQNKYPLVAEQAKKLFELLQTKNGDRQAYLKKIRDTAGVIEERIGKDKNVKETLDDWVAQSTIERTDPTKPRTDYLGDAARLEAWDLMNSLLNERNLTTTQRENLIYGYKMLRDSYSTVYKDLIKTMDTRLSAIEDEGVQQSLRDRLLTQLLQNETIEPYFPLYRKGSHWLFYRALDPLTKRVETYKESFESRGARNKARNLLEGTKGVTDIEVYERGKDKRFGQVDSQFAFDLLGKARKQGMSAELEATLLDALFDIMPERSLIRSFKQRENTLGFQRDALKVFRERAPNFTNQIINLKHDLALNKISTDLDEATLKYRGVDNADFEAAQNLNNTFQGYISFARNPNISSLSKMAKTLGFGWTLGFNISSVLVNASNLPIVVLPYLGGRYGFVDTMKTMNDARKLFMGTGMNRRTETLTGEGQTEVFEGPSLSNIDFSSPNLTPEQRELEELATLMEDRGQSNISTTGENLDMENPANTAWTFANNTMGWMFHQGERANRQITAITSYKLELAKRAKKGELTKQDREEAAESALDDTELTNSGAMIETAPRVSQNNWGNWMTMYKRFGISMYYLQFQMAKQALTNALPIELRNIADAKYGGDQAKLTLEDKQEAEEKAKAKRKEAKSQIVGLFASSALFAGVQGLPLYGIVSWLGNNVFLDDEDEDFDSIAASYFGEGMYSGALNAIFQVDVGPRIGMSNLIYRSQPNRAEQDILLDIAEFVGGPVLGVGRRVIRGGNLIAEGEVWKGSEAVLPSVLSNGLKALRYATEGATTLRNDPIMEDINAWNVFAQSLGLAPAGYTKQLEINARDKGVDRRVNAKRTKLMGDYYLAAKEGNVDEAAELVQEMIEFSERNPYAAISGDSLERSMRQHSVTDEIARQLGGIPASQRAAERILIRRMQDMGEE